MNGLGLDLLQSSLVHDSLSACLLEAGVEELVLSRGKSLEIYRILNGNRLFLYGIYSFGAAIKSFERIRSTPSDMLILRFADCKVYIIYKLFLCVIRYRL